VSYYLKSASPGAKLIVRDAQNTVVRELAAPGDAGFNRVVWDLRANGPAGVPNTRGPFVVPGRYRAYVSAAGGSVATPVDVEWDPAIAVSDEERRLRFTFLIDAGELQKTLHDASTSLASLRAELAKVRDRAPAAAALHTTVEQLQRRIASGGGGEEEGGGGGLRAQVNGLVSEIDGGGAQQGTLTGPTATQRARLDAVKAEVQKVQSETSRVLSDDLSRLNTELEKLGLQRIVVPATRTSSSNQ